MVDQNDEDFSITEYDAVDAPDWWMG